MDPANRPALRQDPQGSGVSITPSTDPLLLLAVFGAALLSGAANAVAGGGTNLSFPILIWLGLPPVAANATNGVGLWPGSAGAAWSYKNSILESPTQWWWLTVPSLIGGGVGAWLLLTLPPAWFGALAPWLVILAAGLVAAEPMMRRRIRLPGHQNKGPLGVPGTMTGQFLISIYGGYFGAGLGILLLSTLGFMGMDNLHRANAWKNVLAVAIKGVAVVYFVLAGVIVWPVALVMALGSIVGGHATGHFIQRMEQDRFRWIVVGIGAGMGLLLLVQQ